MNENDADEMLMLMSQMWWVSSNIPEGTLRIWHSALMSLEKDVVVETINDLVSSNSYWPSIADFRNHYHSLLRRDKMKVEAIERDYLPREENVKRLRALREQLRSKGQPVCIAGDGMWGCLLSFLPHHPALILTQRGKINGTS